MSPDDDVQQASLLAPQDRKRVAALLLVRYCGFLEDHKFAPWFERHHDALAAARDIAPRMCRQGAATEQSEARTAGIRSLAAAGQEEAGSGIPALLARSEAFARPYADVIARCYPDEEAGRS
jgi:hypothetical protein